MVLNWQSVSKDLKSLLENICTNSAFESFYLAGGTALSLYLGHRVSIDLDFFSDKEFYPQILTLLNYSYTPNIIEKNSIDVQVNNIKVFFMYFAFPRHSPSQSVGSIRLASKIDIGLMKLIALQGRLSIKDIIDLSFINNEVIDFSELLKIFDSLYSTEKLNKLNNFSYLFDDSILNQPMPRMLKSLDIEKQLKVLRKKVIEHYKV